MAVDVRTDIKGIGRFLVAEGADPQKLRLHVSQVAPGTSAHPPHQHDGQEIFFVLEGEGEVSMEQEAYPVNAGEAIQVNCGVMHGIRNIGKGPMRYAVIIAREG